MLDQRRRRRGASWVPAASPVGWGRGPSHAAEGPSARRQGGGPDGRLFRDQRPPATGMRPPPPTPCPETPPWGCETRSGSYCLLVHSLPPRSPAPTLGLGTRNADSQPEGPDLPYPGSTWIGLLSSRICQFSLSVPGIVEKSGVGLQLLFSGAFWKAQKTPPKGPGQPGRKSPNLPPTSLLYSSSLFWELQPLAGAGVG